MKINVEMDITPEEFRALMGWPDVQEFQREMFEQIRAQMQAGVEGYDPLTLMKPYLAQSLQSMEALQKMMAGAMRGYAPGGKKTSQE